MSRVLTDQIEKRTGGTAIDLPATGKWPTAAIADGAITATQITAATITNTEIAASTITPAQMADSAFLANRNFVINGAMQVAQRATSEAGVVGGVYSACDRWESSISSDAVWTVSQDSTSPDGLANSLKMDCTTVDTSLGAAQYIGMRTSLEGQNLQSLKKGTASAESITVSFWVYSNLTGTYALELFDVDNTRYNSVSYTIVSANTWEQKTLTFSGDTTGALGDDNGSSLRVHFFLGAGSDRSGGTFTSNVWHTTAANRYPSSGVNLASSTSNVWYLTGVQMEIGITATPFEQKTYAQELEACLRYFEKESLAQTYMVSNGDNSGFMAYDLNWGVKKRAAPTITFSTWAVYNYITLLGDQTTANGWSPNSSVNVDSMNIGASKATHGLGNLFTMRLINVTLSADAEL